MLSKKEILEVKEDLRNWELVDLEKKIKSLQSLKSRYGKIEKKKKEMEDILIKERIVREVIIEKKEKKVFIYERLENEIMVMSIEEVMRGIKNIDSILCIERSKELEFQDKEKMVKCDNVREWLVNRKLEVSGNSSGKVNVSDVLRKIEDVESIEDLKEWLVEKSK